MTDENKKREASIVHDLNEIAKLRGAFGLEPAALDMYKEEYDTFYNHSPLMEDTALSGYAGRRHHILLKVAMCVSASSRDNRLISTSDMHVAINLMRKAEENMPHILRAIEAEKVGDTYEEIVQFMIRRKILSRAELIRRFRHKMSSEQLDVFMRTMEEEGAVKVEIDGRQVRYIFTGKAKRT